jgi:chorismate-pyruvate lyase
MSMGLLTGSVGSSLSAPAPAAGSSAGDRRQGEAAPAPANEESLAERYGIDHPLDRMALTANGNLQRLVCSYYDSPVSVTLDSQHRSSPAETRPPASAGTSHVWHRVVRLSVFQRTFCTATSVITVHDPACQALVESGRVGLGQLFRYLDLLPEFTLLGAGTFPTPASSPGERNGPGTTKRTNNFQGGGGNFWREYRLDCSELSCSIREEFCPRLWDLWPGPDD